MLKGAGLTQVTSTFDLHRFCFPLMHYRHPWGFTMVSVTAINKVGADKMRFVN